MLPDHSAADPLKDLAYRFEWAADNVFKGTSPVYERLSRGMAQDRELLAIAAAADPHQPIPVLLYGAVQYLMLGGVEHPLAMHFPTVSGVEPSNDDPMPAFRDFCLTFADPIREIISTRRVQTNEVRRCACFLPAFGTVAALGADRRLALVEFGTSAGLNLLWDRYYYDYGEAGQVGDPTAALHLTTQLRGDVPVPIPVRLPEIASRVGIDLHPIDVTDPDQARWLRALIWPEHVHRAERLTQAIEIARQNPPPLRAGSVFDLLPECLDAAPAESTLVVFHSYVINQFSAQMRDDLSAMMSDYSTKHDLFRVSIEWLNTLVPELRIAEYRGGTEVRHDVVAHCEQHGTWLEWLAAG